MPQAITDYVSLADKFLQHWNDAESELGRAITLEDGTTRDGLQDLKEELITSQQTTLDAENGRQAAIKERDRGCATASPIARQVRKSIIGLIPSSDQARQLPAKLLPSTSEVQKQLVGLRDIESIWASVNALPGGTYPSLVLPFTVRVDLGGTEETVTLARYSATITALASAASAVETAEQTLTQAQQKRKKVVEALKKLFLAYRAAIRGLFPRTSALYRSLP
jgi:hypothetical protein